MTNLTFAHLRQQQTTFLTCQHSAPALASCAATLQAYMRDLHSNSEIPRILLDDVLAYEQPTKYLVASEEYSDEFTTPVLTANKGFVLGYTDDATGIYPASPEHPVIIFDDFTTAVQWVDFPFKVKSTALKILTARDGSVATLRYAFQALQNTGFVPTEHKRHWISVISQLEIRWPAPSIRQALADFFDIGVARRRVPPA